MLIFRKTVQNRTRVLVVALVTVLLNPAAQTSAAREETPYEWSGVARIVAIGDIHGAYDTFVSVLVNAGLVNDRLDWVGGTTHLVQTGDIVDRGPDSRKVMDLLMKLEKQAERAGGRTHVLIGNHEAMNVVGIVDAVSAEEFASYTDAESPSRRDRVFEFFYKEQKDKAKAEGKVAPSRAEVRTDFESKCPLGYIEHRHAFGPKGRYGRWIRKKNAAIRINSIVFSHGDWSQDLAALGIHKFNELVRDELSGKAPLTDGVAFRPDSPLQYRRLSKVPLARAEQEASRASVDRILSHLQATRMVVGHTLGIHKFNELVRDELSGKAPLTDGVAFRPDSPLQYRRLSKVPLARAEQEASRASVDRILSHLQATRMVVGHTLTGGFIESRFGGKHISIDAGMLELYRGGHQIALEIEGHSLRAIHPLGKVAIPNGLDETTLFDYLVEVAAVDPENVDVLGQLAQLCRTEEISRSTASPCAFSIGRDHPVQ